MHMYIVLTKYQIASSKAVVGVDWPIKALCVYIVSAKYQIVPSKAVVGVDRPMKAPSMHIQKPKKGKLV